MSEVRIAAEPRTEFGKGAARRVRRANRVPAVLYGHGSDPKHISLPGHELMLALKTPNVLLRLDLQDGGVELVLPKAVQRDPIKGLLEHVDLVIVKLGEKVTVEVPVHLVGNAGPDTLVVLEINSLPVEAEATHLPGAIEISIEGLRAGTQVQAKDVKLPKGTTLAIDAEALIVNITGAPTEDQLEAELAEAEAEAGIVHELSDADAAAETEAADSSEAGDAAAKGEGDKAES